MTKLARITGKTFGETASPIGSEELGPEIGQFGSALAGTYNGTSDVATIQSLSAWSDGFISAVTPQNQYPPLPEMTGALKVLSHQENYILQQGMPEWDSATTYYEDGFCSYNGIIYKSLQDSNLNNQPDEEPTYWVEYGAVSVATSSTLGIVMPDNTSITIQDGVLSAHGALVISSVVGSTWYRLYEDGWKECGGIVATSQSEINWTQPYLNGNGTLGGASFAVLPSSEYSDTYAAWKAFDGNTTGNQYAGWRTRSMAKGYTHDIIIYNPTAIKISQISYLNYDQTVLAPVSGTVYGSNDNSSWVEITTYTNSVTASGSTWYIDVSNNTNYYKYYKITFKNGASAGYLWCTEIGLTAKYLGAYGNAITFPISFSNTNYSFAFGFVGASGADIYVTSKTSSGMTLSSSPLGTCYWTAKGF